MTLLGNLAFIPSQTFLAGTLHPQPPQYTTYTTTFSLTELQPITEIKL